MSACLVISPFSRLPEPAFEWGHRSCYYRGEIIVCWNMCSSLGHAPALMDWRSCFRPINLSSRAASKFDIEVVVPPVRPADMKQSVRLGL